MSDEERELEQARARANDPYRVGKVVHVTQALEGEDEDFGPPRTVSCRGCGRPTEMSGFAWWCGKRSSEFLLRKGEAPLDQDSIMLCPNCAALERAHVEEVARGIYRVQVPLVQQAKERGYLTTEDSRWLIQHGMNETVEALETRFRRESERKQVRGGAASEVAATTRAADMEEP